jgi:site-specific DNA recombinase
MTRRARTQAPDAAKRCAVYTRKSTTAGLEQAFNSLDAQRDACVSYLQRQPGWTVVEQRYDDGGFTGANTDRPAFQRLLADVDAGRIDVVVVYKVDRLSRSLLDFAKVMERFGAAGTSFVSVTQNFSTADAMGRLTLNMLMSFAEFEREMISERTRDKIGASRRKGKWTGGSVPLGYRVVDKQLVIHELEAVVVRDIFALYLAERSVLAVTRILNERHRAVKRECAHRPGSRPDPAWTKNDVQRVLKNSIYAGWIRHDDQLYEGEHARLVDRSTFGQVQAQLAAATHPRAPSVRNPEYLLRGVLRCACCGAGFTTASTHAGHATYRYYRCITRDKRGAEACPSGPLPAEAIEHYVVAQLRTAIATGSLVAEVTAAVQARVAAHRANLGVERAQLPGQIAALSDESRRLIETLDTVTGPARALVQERLRALDARLSRAQQRLQAVERELGHIAEVELDAAWVARCLDDFPAVWDVLTPENRLRFVQTVVDRIEVNALANEVKIHLVGLAAQIPGTAEPAPPALDPGNGRP